MRRRRTVRIDEDEIPLSDAMVLGARRRPQTGDESDAWMMMFLASLSALAAWILKGAKK
ncbi:MAG: LPXTG cell wall anchor domain-containing protein [Acetatifactor sp.]|nr:LPXTG cell wall anchor domain-containing protein [Acetatifactor sp.]